MKKMFQNQHGQVLHNKRTSSRPGIVLDLEEITV